MDTGGYRGKLKRAFEGYPVTQVEVDVTVQVGQVCASTLGRIFKPGPENWAALEGGMVGEKLKWSVAEGTDGRFNTDKGRDDG